MNITDNYIVSNEPARRQVVITQDNIGEVWDRLMKAFQKGSSMFAPGTADYIDSVHRVELDMERLLNVFMDNNCYIPPQIIEEAVSIMGFVVRNGEQERYTLHIRMDDPHDYFRRC